MPLHHLLPPRQPQAAGHCRNLRSSASESVKLQQLMLLAAKTLLLFRMGRVQPLLQEEALRGYLEHVNLVEPQTPAVATYGNACPPPSCKGSP